MTQTRIEQSALAQLEHIFGYSVSRWGLEQASVYSDALYDAINAIAARRFLWRRLPASFEIDGYVHKCGHHLIYWRCDEDEVVRIVAILHERMHQFMRLREALDGEP